MLIWARIVAQEAVWPIENDFVVVLLCKKAIEKQGHEQQLVFLLCHLIHLLDFPRRQSDSDTKATLSDKSDFFRRQAT